VADEMGHKDLEPSRTEPEEKYKLITYSGKNVPFDFINLIQASFKNSLRYGNDLYKLIDRNDYYAAYEKYIALLLQRPAIIVKFAMLEDQTILGWCMIENKTVHYVWVKKEVRRNGICQELLPKDFTTISHITNKGINMWVNHFPHVKFNPFS
jgi:hypothetical protein